LFLLFDSIGIQYAGRQLSGLQKAMNNPFGNLGTILKEGNKRFQHSIGLSSVPSFSEYVDPKLRNDAAIVSKAIQHFGASVEYLLFKYKKNIIHEQMLLKRLADSAIDIYSMVVVISRVTRALNKNLNSAGIEMNMCHVICNEVKIAFIILLLFLLSILI
jgi:very long chain acyl-CoA dehydrogenase